ncbi:hypothetical protein D9757_005619 [Collybiopsis confluens]|uniref:Homologous-pairing protein 2 winged helix domain-containing protein n=1 Tax=Collybiopsis confluens TaxID=2823264 RepID=A0A8H5MCC0_9AGAR|nr:hypothetical protein D9757_005619 [Collybiopsis confluens]
MSSKAKSDAKVLKGQEAHSDASCPPDGAVDIAANLKGAVPKAATQKILVALAEKGELIQKTYGKTTFFVANQAKIDTLAPAQISVLEEEYKKLDEENKLFSSQIKSAIAELAKIRNTPSDSGLCEQITSVEEEIVKRSALLEPLRTGAPPMTTDEIAQIEASWLKWKDEWMRRRKVFNTSALKGLLQVSQLTFWADRFWQIATDVLPPQDATILSEDLGIEYDTPEHAALEKSSLCARDNLKRKR